MILTAIYVVLSIYLFISALFFIGALWELRDLCIGPILSHYDTMDSMLPMPWLGTILPATGMVLNYVIFCAVTGLLWLYYMLTPSKSEARPRPLYE